MCGCWSHNELIPPSCPWTTQCYVQELWYIFTMYTKQNVDKGGRSTELVYHNFATYLIYGRYNMH